MPDDERDSDRRHAEQRALHGRRHRARVGDVVAHIAAVVDARDHQVRLDLHDAVDRQVDRVGRRAVDGKMASIDRIDAQRAVEAQ
jgi:hypothetical protein